jgi:phosphatidylglycerophosphate synthase
MVYWRRAFHRWMDSLLDPLKGISISPNQISWLSLFLSMPTSILFRAGLVEGALVLLFVVLVLDALDGFVARRRRIASFQGLIVDASCDRISEFVIFYSFPLWTGLAVVNCWVTLWRLRRRQVSILPLRHAFLVMGLLRLAGLPIPPLVFP